MRAVRVGLNDRVSFAHAPVDEAAAILGATFDGVYTSWGVMTWLPDIQVWANNIAGLLRPGGWLYVADTHPYAASVRWTAYPYGSEHAVFSDQHGDYTDPNATFEHPESWQWNHGLGEIVTALIDAGMSLQWLHEHREVAWHMGDPDHLVEADGMWEQPGSTLPLAYSLRAIRSYT